MKGTLSSDIVANILAGRMIVDEHSVRLVEYGMVCLVLWLVVPVPDRIILILVAPQEFVSLVPAVGHGELG